MSSYSMARLSRYLRLAGLIGGYFVVSFACASPPEQERHCDEMDATSISSPDGTWIAKSYGEACDSGLSSSAAVVVELVRAGSTTFHQVVLGMSMPSAKSGWPKVTWDSPNKLLIDLPSSAEIGLQVANFQGVEINLRFCPRDPAVRAGWIEYRASYRRWLADTTAWAEANKRKPASAGPKPTRPTPPGTGLVATCSE